MNRDYCRQRPFHPIIEIGLGKGCPLNHVGLSRVPHGSLEPNVQRSAGRAISSIVRLPAAAAARRVGELITVYVIPRPPNEYGIPSSSVAACGDSSLSVFESPLPVCRTSSIYLPSQSSHLELFFPAPFVRKAQCYTQRNLVRLGHLFD